MELISDYPALVAEDMGFLKHLQEDILKKHLNTLNFAEGMSFCEKVEALRARNEAKYGCGVTLPFYIPQIDDSGQVWGYKTEVAWSDEVVDFPLYGDCAKDSVSMLVHGKKRKLSIVDGWSLSEELMELAPAFRVAILTHYILQNVLMKPLAAEAFVLGSYSEVPFEDAQFKETGIPTTSLVSVVPQQGTSETWVMDSPSSWHGAISSNASYKGWTVHVRGSAPKESVLRQAWQEIKERGRAPRGLGVFVSGTELMQIENGPNGRDRSRAGDPRVDRMVQIVDSLMEQGAFPKKGSRNDWKTVHAMIELNNPGLAGVWTTDSMRRIYKMRKEKESDR